MDTRYSKILALAAGLLLALAGCSEDKKQTNLTGGTGGDPGTGGTGGDPGTGGTGGGTGGTGGTGGSGEPGCQDLPIPGPIAEGSWSPNFTIAGLTGQDGVSPSVYGLSKDADGSVIATGYFRWAGTRSVPPAVKKTANGWEPLRDEWGMDLPRSGFSTASASDDGKLALATFFAGPPGGWGPPVPRNTEIWLDEGAGFTRIAGVAGLVRDMVWYDGKLWIAGPFELEGGESAGVAVWDGTSWNEPPGGMPDGAAYTLVRDGDGLLVGGSFDTIGGIVSPKVAEWNGNAWVAHGLEMPGHVYSLARHDGALYAGGVILPDVEDVMEMAGGIAREVGGTWEILGGGVAAGYFPGVVSNLATFQGDLYMTGCFDSINGGKADPDAFEASSVARWTADGWEAVAYHETDVRSFWVGSLSCGDDGPYAAWDMQYQRFLVDDDRLLLAGAFAGIQGVPSYGIIAFDGENWIPQGESGDGFSGEPGPLAVGGPDCSVYALGIGASHAGGAPVTGVLHYDGGWKSVGGRAPSGQECEHIAVDRSGRIFVGCTEDLPWPAMPRPRIFAVDATGWRPVGEPHSIEGVLFDMATDRHDRIWIAGGAEKGFVARLEDGSFEVLSNAFDAPVARLAVEPAREGAPTRAVASGWFEKVGGVAAPGTAHYDGAAWEALPSLGASVTALAYGENGIYASANFEFDDARPILAKLNSDGDAWEELATPANGLPVPYDGTTHTFTRLVPRGDLLIASGYVWPEEGGRNVFVWDGTRFTSVGGGLAAISVNSIAIASDGLWFSGSIAEAGLPGERMPTVGIARFEWR